MAAGSFRTQFAPLAAHHSTAQHNTHTSLSSQLKLAVEYDKGNAKLLLLLASVLQNNNSSYEEALECYKKAMDVLEKEGKDVSFIAHANVGVLHYQLGNTSQAGDSLEASLKELGNTSGSSTSLSSDLLVQFLNQRSYEDTRCKITVNPTDKKIITFAKVANGPSVQQWKKLRINSGDMLQIGENFKVKVASKSKENDQNNSLVLEEECELAGEQSVFRLGNMLQPDTVSVAFNLARLHEHNGEFKEACEIHKAIVKLHPNYVNSYLRLACIAKDNGLLKVCSDWLSQAIKVAPTNPEILSLIGNAYMDGKDWEGAQSAFELVLGDKEGNAMNAYSKIALGNIYFSNIKNPGKYARNLKYAAGYYKQVLANDDKNLYAANGIGCVLAEKGELLKAKDIFNRVRECSGDTIGCVLVNLAHVYIAQGKHSEAIKMYENCNNKFHGGKR